MYRYLCVDSSEVSNVTFGGQVWRFPLHLLKTHKWTSADIFFILGCCLFVTKSILLQFDISQAEEILYFHSWFSPTYILVLFTISVDFDYPDFDEAFATPTPDQTSQNQANETVDQSKPSLQSLQFPKIDRSTKPKVSQTAGPSGVPSVVNSNSLTDNEKINDLKSAITSLYPSTGSISGGKYINVESYGASSLLEKEKEELNKIKKEKEEELARFQLEKDKILKVSWGDQR